MFVMSLLVFVGVYAIGNPIDVRSRPTSRRRSGADDAQYGFDRPLWEQYAASSAACCTAISDARSVQHAGRPDLQPSAATLSRRCPPCSCHLAPAAGIYAG
jgi:peptide/nickel transport system permease protein